MLLSSTFPPAPQAPAAARRLIDSLVGQDLPLEMKQDAELLANEVVANSVRHAGLTEQDSIGLTVELTDDHLRVSVTDNGEGFELASVESSDDDVGGWGLVMVDRLADRWGVVRNRPDMVWFEFDR